MKRAEKFMTDNNLKPKAGAKQEKPIFVDDILMVPKKRDRRAKDEEAAAGPSAAVKVEEAAEAAGPMPTTAKKRRPSAAVKVEEAEEEEMPMPTTAKKRRPSAAIKVEEDQEAEEEEMPLTQSPKKQCADLATASRVEMMKTATVSELRDFLQEKAVEFTTDESKQKLISHIYKWRLTL
jgi:hypothetical protein